MRPSATISPDGGQEKAWNCDLLLALDVYEHAYFLDFQTARAKYIDAWLSVIDWTAVNTRLARAK
jgi:Fe-Mn family superoxide dismutase